MCGSVACPPCRQESQCANALQTTAAACLDPSHRASAELRPGAGRGREQNLVFTACARTMLRTMHEVGRPCCLARPPPDTIGARPDHRPARSTIATPLQTADPTNPRDLIRPGASLGQSVGALAGRQGGAPATATSGRALGCNPCGAGKAVQRTADTDTATCPTGSPVRSQQDPPRHSASRRLQSCCRRPTPPARCRTPLHWMLESPNPTPTELLRHHLRRLCRDRRCPARLREEAAARERRRRERCGALESTGGNRMTTECADSDHGPSLA